jgi:hypothetical protein
MDKLNRDQRAVLDALLRSGYREPRVTEILQRLAPAPPDQRQVDSDDAQDAGGVASPVRS